jgi:hypothetical protein
MNKRKFINKMIGSLEPYEGKVYLVCCIGVEYDYDIVPHFIKYYKDMGVDEFLFILNTEYENSQRLKYVQNILEEHGIKEKEVWIGEFNDLPKKMKMEKTLDLFTRSGDWILFLDVDELLDCFCNLRSFISYCEKGNYNCLYGELIDRLSLNEKISKINGDDIFKDFPVERIIRARFSEEDLKNIKQKEYESITSHKMPLIKKGICLSIGHHIPVPDESSLEICNCEFVVKINHFRYRDNLIKKLEKRCVDFKNQGTSRWIEWENELNFLKSNGFVNNA